MAQVTIAVNGRSYVVGCEDGQEERLRRLAATVDAQVRALVGRAGQIGEARLLLIAALSLADDLQNLHDENRNLETAAQQTQAELAGHRARRPAASEADLAAIAARLEDIAARLEKP